MRSRCLLVLAGAFACAEPSSTGFFDELERPDGGPGLETDAAGPAPQPHDGGPRDLGLSPPDAGTSPATCGSSEPIVFEPSAGPLAFFEPRDIGLPRVPAGAAILRAIRFRHEGPQALYTASVVEPNGGFFIDAPERALADGDETRGWMLGFQADAPGRSSSTLELRRGDEVARIPLEAEVDDAPRLGCTIGPVLDMSIGSKQRVELVCTNSAAIPRTLSSLTVAALGPVGSGLNTELPLEGLTLEPYTSARFAFELCARDLGEFTVLVSARVDEERVANSATAEVTSGLEIDDQTGLQFGGGAEAARFTIPVRNRGIEPAQIERVLVAGDFDLISPTSLTVVAPGGQIGIEIAVREPSPESKTGLIQLGIAGRFIPVRVEANPRPGVLATSSCLSRLALPETLDLGPAPGASSFSMSVANASSDRCALDLVTSARVRVQLLQRPDPDGRFLELGPGAAQRWLVRMEPSASEVEELEIYDRSAATAPRVVRIQRIADGSGPDVDFRQRPVRAPQPRCGLEESETRAFFRVGTGAQLVTAAEAAIDVQRAGREYMLTPNACGPNNATVVVRSADGRERRVPLGLRPSIACDGVPAASSDRQFDLFELPSVPPVDLVVIVDDSPSMRPHLENVQDNLLAFAQFFTAQSIDYQAFFASSTEGFVRGEDGHPLAVTPAAQPTAVEAWLQAAPVGAQGSSIESIFDVMDEVPGLPLRSGSLSVIVITDEADGSDVRTSTLLDRLNQIKGVRNPQLWSVFVVSGGEDGCTRAGVRADPSPRLQDLSELTAGFSVPICGFDWSRTLEDLSGNRPSRRPQLSLTNQPVIDSIEVHVDGAPMPATEPSGRVNWSYDFPTNSINFSAFSFPAPGASVEISYLAECP